VHRIVLSDRKVKLRELAEAVGISKERAGYILYNVLEMKKLSARWVPRLRRSKTAACWWLIQRPVWRCCSVIERTFFDILWRWMKRGFIIIRLSPIGSLQSGWKATKADSPQKATKDQLGREDYGLRFLGCAWHNLHRLPAERKNSYGRVLCSVIGNDEIKKKRPHMGPRRKNSIPSW